MRRIVVIVLVAALLLALASVALAATSSSPQWVKACGGWWPWSPVYGCERGDRPTLPPGIP